MKLMITGASGVLGSHLVSFYKDRFEIIGVYRHHLIDFKDVKMVQADLSAGDQVDKLIGTYAPDALIHCAALVDMDRCERDIPEANKQNVLPLENLSRSLQGRGIKLVYISTDCVYDPKGNLHREGDLEVPVNQYGLSKLMGEKAALTLSGAVSLRTTFFGLGTVLKKTHTEHVISSLLSNKKLGGFSDVFFSPLYVLDLARIIEQVLQKDLKGTFNVGTSDGVSKFSFLQQIAHDLGLNENLIEPISVDSLSLAAKRNKNAVMNVNRVTEALGMKMPSVKETVSRFVEDYRMTMNQSIGKGI